MGIKSRPECPEMRRPHPEFPEGTIREAFGALATYVFINRIRECCDNIDNAAEEAAGNV